jgi:hypothetical protein
MRARPASPAIELDLPLPSLAALEPSGARPVPAPPAALPPSVPLAKQIALGLAIFAGILAASLPLAFVSEGLALTTAVGVGSVMVALLARRLLIALLIATLLAVLGSFAATHSVHLSQKSPTVPARLTALAPAAGPNAAAATTAAPPEAIVLPVRVHIGGDRVPIAGWAFPGALFLLWAVGFAAIRANRQLARWLLRRFAKASVA